MSNLRWVAYALLATLYVLHNDWWLWNDASLGFAGLPAGLAYHLVYMFATMAVLGLVVRVAWPTHLDDGDGR